MTPKTKTETLIAALHRRGISSLNNLTAVSNNAGTAVGGGLSALTQSGQITNLILSFLGNNKDLEKKYLQGEVGIELCPQGTLAERLRAGGAGVPAFFTPTGAREWDSLFPFSLLFFWGWWNLYSIYAEGEGPPFPHR